MQAFSILTVTFHSKRALNARVPWTDASGTDVAESKSTQLCTTLQARTDLNERRGEGAVFSRSEWCMRRGNVTREKRVNVWNCWPTDQALPHHHRRRHRQHRSVRESGVAAGGGPGYLTRRTRLCKGSHVRRAFWQGFHREDVKRALQSGARASTVRQRLIIKEPN